MQKRIRESLQQGVELRQRVASMMTDAIEEAAGMCLESLRHGGKILLMGNGGSAADAQHIAGELVGRYLIERRAIPAISLSTDTSVLTCLGNDYSYDYIFERQIEAIGRAGDIAFGISTSGNSENVRRALQKAKDQKMGTIGLLGRDGGKIREICDLALVVPSDDTPRIQEIHITIGHILCEEIEKGIDEE